MGRPKTGQAPRPRDPRDLIGRTVYLRSSVAADYAPVCPDPAAPLCVQLYYRGCYRVRTEQGEVFDAKTHDISLMDPVAQAEYLAARRREMGF